jgi:enoyl-CoA hydratase/carnithine racemase
MLRGTGKYFCSGYDIGSIGGDRRVDFAAVVDAVEEARPVCIAVLHGSVYGGATDLALACDFRIGAEGIDMFMPAARLGLHYYRSGLERYVARLGLDNAKRLFLTAEKLNARQMKEIGFLTHWLRPTADDRSAASAGRDLRQPRLDAMLVTSSQLDAPTLDAGDLGNETSGG